MSMIMKTPNNLTQLVECLKDIDENTYALSGGTDLIIKMKKDKIHKGTLIDLKGINELNYIKEENDFIRVGAGTTFTTIEESEIIKSNCICVSLASGQVGSTQIRNWATIGGNVANAFAGADLIPTLLLMDSKVVTINSHNERIERSIDEVIIGLGKNSLNRDEIIIEIIIPKYKGYESAFAKLGSRTRVTISKLNMSVLLKKEGNKILDSRVVLGALGPKAFRATMVEEFLNDKEIDEKLLDRFYEVLSKQVDEAIPTRKSRTYKREAIKGLGSDIYKQLLG
ncbi:FAD binding domain-containing protein [Anaeromicrobium sediminis]|uniref:FAD-binding PCMH-type domain-containing protein n=1 Tax=Anaeromicrobium sediminis TaxID=1478221 RepID=A0A267MKI7_9FIRM|nr:FAD binding domain-containing protein [Anaeromicrobium sediminis]PAB59313.1 hypothetical protein CCE28_10645 [Anaeromicrobium sediminis]